MCIIDIMTFICERQKETKKRKEKSEEMKSENK